MKDKWKEFAGDFTSPEELRERLSEAGYSEDEIDEIESNHFGES